MTMTDEQKAEEVVKAWSTWRVFLDDMECTNVTITPGMIKADLFPTNTTTPRSYSVYLGDSLEFKGRLNQVRHVGPGDSIRFSLEIPID